MGIKLDLLKEKEYENYLRGAGEKDRVFVKGRVIEAVFAFVSYGIPLLRTEGPGDVTTLDVATNNGVISVPAILPEKIQAKLRREMVEKLRSNMNGNILNVIKDKYKKLGFQRIGEGEDWTWNCFIAPPIEAARETDLGMCGYCPSCNLLGTIITPSMLRPQEKGISTTYGIKGRVLYEIAFATQPYKSAVAELTHNRVGDGLSYTGQSLYGEPHVLPGVVFVSKLAMYDVTRREAELVLSSLAEITRIGAGETKYGRVKTVLLGVKGGQRETLSSYEIARHVLEKQQRMTPEQVLKEIAGFISGFGFKLLVDSGALESLEKLDSTVELEQDFFERLWSEDNLSFATSVVNYVVGVERGQLHAIPEGQPKKERGKRA